MEDFIIAMPGKKLKQNKNKQTKNKSEKIPERIRTYNITYMFEGSGVGVT